LAKIAISNLAAGQHTITASYSGDSDYSGATSEPYTEVVNQTFSTSWVPSHSVNVTNFGVAGDGVTDNTAALQNLINASASGTLFYFPAGTYLIKNTINLAGLPNFGMIGDVDATGSPASTITSSVANITMISVDYGGPGGTFQIKNMNFVGPPGGITFYKTGTNSDVFENCQFSGHIGLKSDIFFESTLRNVSFFGDGSAGSIGLLGGSGVMVDSYFTGWENGVRSWSIGTAIIRTKFEANHIGVNIGADANDVCYNASNVIADSTFVSNDTAIYGRCPVSSLYSNDMIQGTSNAPSGQSQYGLNANGEDFSTIFGLDISGGFTHAAVGVGGAVQYSTFYANSVSNSIGQAWSLPANFAQLTAVSISNSPLNIVSSLDDTTAYTLAGSVQPTAASHDMVYDVTAYGLVGDFNTDNTAALQNLINSVPNGPVLYFPSGTYLFSGMVDLSRLTNVTLIGDTVAWQGFAGSVLRGYFPGPLLQADYIPGAGSVRVRNLTLSDENNHNGGISFYGKNLALSSFENVEFAGDIGLRLENAFMTTILSPRSQSEHGPNNVLQLMGCMGCTVDGADFDGDWEGIMASGTNVTVFGSRLEVNYTAIDFGVDENGNMAALFNSAVTGNWDFESNAISYNIRNCTNCFFGAGSTWDHYPTWAGTYTNPTRDSPAIVGVNVDACQHCTFASLGIQGQYSQGATVVSSSAANVLFTDGYSSEVCSANGYTVPQCQTATPPTDWSIQNATTTFLNEQYP
jgi:hypothetical protein